ncbi:FAD-binding oxidoreductase [Radicibacter daui]|uniref:FAD-binding oxidoreductase n=1 Tax=Radicibacter daui TaxID=3064829 RepID=UPI004046B362
MSDITAGLLAELAALLGPRGLLTEAGDKAPYEEEMRRLFSGSALAIARPASTEELAATVKACHAVGVAMIPQGGNTGLVGGSVPDGSGKQLVISLGRMNRVRSVDTEGYTMVVEAGCILADVQAAAEAAGRLFPLSLAAQASCQIGGNLSSNAGGINTLRYGNTRDLVLGIEVVLPDGSVLDLMNALRKNNTGYDLKHLFLGGEGTLGIISAAVLKLFPAPKQTATAFIGLCDAGKAITLLSRLRAASGDSISAFELMERPALELCLEHIPATTNPLAGVHDFYVLCELTSPGTAFDLSALLMGVLEEALEEGLVEDATVAASLDQRTRLWHIREHIPEAQRKAGASIKNDISVPVAAVPALLERARAAVLERIPDARPIAFGHAGDGNIHFNISVPRGGDSKAFLQRWDEITDVVGDVALALGGSISAEHGIGRLKRDKLASLKSPAEMQVMRRIKAALDPSGLMNPGALL